MPIESIDVSVGSNRLRLAIVGGHLVRSRLVAGTVAALCLLLTACLEENPNTGEILHQAGDVVTGAQQGPPDIESVPIAKGPAQLDALAEDLPSAYDAEVLAPKKGSAEALPINNFPAVSDYAVRAQTIALLEQKKGIEKLPLIVQLGVLTAELPDAEPALEALEEAARQHDPDVSRVATGILANLQQLQQWDEEMSSGAMAALLQDAEILPPDAMARPSLPYLDDPAQSLPLTHLVRQALDNPDERERAAAINELSLQRSEPIVDILLQAASDNAPANRRQALQALWHSATVGFDADKRISEVLWNAIDDPNVGVAEVARQALDDLDKLNAPPTGDMFIEPNVDPSDLPPGALKQGDPPQN